MRSHEGNAAERLATHLANCRKMDAAIVTASGDADGVVASMVAEGWTLGGIEFVEGRRVRYLVAPENSSKIPVDNPTGQA